jgi:3-methyl-2-oxobutanoate hydroxymethyltransferase
VHLREVAAMITKELKISTIGIGAGLECDIQVLVLHDLIGMTFGRQPRFVRQYVNLREVMTDAIQRWSSDVKAGEYPNEKESYGLTDETMLELEQRRTARQSKG